MITRKQGLEPGGSRGHARGEHGAGAVRALQRGEDSLGKLVGGVVRPGVDPVLPVGAVQLPLIVRGRADHGGQAARYRVGLTQGLGGQRLP